MAANVKAWQGGFKRAIGDASLGATLALALDNTTKQIHICDIEDVNTDWGKSNDSYPTVYIHDIAEPITDYVRIYHNGTNGIIDCDGTTILSMTATSLDITGTLGITGDVTVTGGVTWTAAIDVTLTAPTTADNAIYGLITASAAWTAGNMTAVRGLVTLSGTNNYVSATGGWFGLDFATKTGSGSGLTCAINAEITSNNAVAPNAIVYLQSLPNGSTADFSNVPFIAFTEYAASGTGSGLLFECGHQPAGANRNVTTGASGIFNTTTLRIKVNGNVRYIPLSTATNAITTAAVITTSNATGSGSTSTGALIVTGGAGIGEDIYMGGDLYLATGKKIDFNAGDVTITHASNLLTIAGGGLTMGASGTPAGDFILWPTLALAKVWLDVDGDTNGAWYFGADTKGIQVNLYGDVTGCGVFWDPTTDTNGTLTIGGSGGSAGNDVVMYGDTNGASMTWDQSADYLVFAGAGRLEVGTFASPISLDTFTGNEDIHGAMVSSLIDAAMTSGECARNIWSRMKVTADQAQNVSIYGACLQLRAHTGSQTVELSAGLYSGAWMYFEASDDSYAFTLSGAEVMGGAATVEAVAGSALTTGSVYGIKINSAVADSISVSGLTSFSALYINAGSGKEPWTTGIKIEDDHVVTGIDIGNCTTGITLSGVMTTGISLSGTFAAATSKAINSAITVNIPNYTDGLGANNFDLTTTGVMAGHTAATSSWISLNGTVASGGWIVAAQTNGIWVNTGGSGNISNAIAVIGMRMSAISTGNASKLTCFSVNVSGDTLDGIFHIAAGENNLGEVANAGTAISFLVPLYINDAGVKKYVKLYDLQ